MTSTRWIFGFRSQGRRSLEPEEIRRIQLALRQTRARTVLSLVSTVLLAATTLISFIGAIGQNIWLAIIPMGSCVGFIWSFATAKRLEKMGWIFARTLRLGHVETFSRQNASPVREGWPSKFTDDEECAPEPHWIAEERFEAALLRMARAPVNQFETVDQDGVLVFINGTLVDRELAPFLFVSPDKDGLRTIPYEERESS